MKSKQNLNKKTTSHKNGKAKQKYQCSCIRFFISTLKNMEQVQRNETCEGETQTPAVIKIPSAKTSKLKSIGKSQIIHIPKIGCDIPFLVTLFTNLSDTGAVRMDDREIMNAVNITAKAKKDVDEGKQWNGNIEIAENLKLKLYKSGLILYHKNKEFP